jgi:hypothetical protein
MIEAGRSSPSNFQTACNDNFVSKVAHQRDRGWHGTKRVRELCAVPITCDVVDWVAGNKREEVSKTGHLTRPVRRNGS